MTKTARMRLVKKVHKAAELIHTEKERYCCFALIEVESRFRYLRRKFNRLFATDASNTLNHNHKRGAWAQEYAEWSHMPEVIHRRVMLLLWFAHMIEVGEIK